MTIPENPADQSAWLESLLVGPDLGRLVAELRAVHGVDEPSRSLDAVLGRWADTVLRNGLSALPRENLRELLRHPRPTRRWAGAFIFARYQQPELLRHPGQDAR